MRKEFLKLAGVKTEKQFYAKYPDEKSFFKAHPEAKKMIKKAQAGLNVPAQTASFLNSFSSVPGYMQMGGMELPDVYGPREEVQGVLGGLKPAGVKMPIYPGVEPLKGIPQPNKFDVGKLAPLAGELIGGIQSIGAQRDELKKARQMNQLTSVQALAAESLPEQYDKKIVRPEDNIVTGENFFPVDGVGTTVLAKNGAEIQNTYAPNTLYTDLETFQTGGKLKKAFFGDFMTSGGGDLMTKGVQGLAGNSAGSQIGGTVGKGLGMIGGPLGSAIGGLLGSTIGGLIDPTQRQIKKEQQSTDRNVRRAMGAQTRNLAQNMYSANLEYGGEISELEQGGELQTYWGGYAEPISENPYLPDGGETVMFRGQSHDESDGKGNTGIGASFGKSKEATVEVEDGEPAVKLKDGGTGEDNLVVYGNLQIPKYGAEMLGDNKAKGKKFKNYVADLSKKENRATNLLDSSMEKIDELQPITKFDKLKMASLEANVKGGNMKLKEIAEKKMKAADLQSVINYVADTNGFDADALSKGKVEVDRKVMKLREAMFGTSISKFDEGGELPKLKEEDYNLLTQLYEKAEKTKNPADVLKFQQEYHRVAPEYAKAVIGKSPLTNYAKKKGYSIDDLRGNEDSIFGERTKQYMAKIKDNFTKRERSKDIETPEVKEQGKTDTPNQQDNVYDVRPTKRNLAVDIAGQALPFLRPTNAEPLDANQLMGEMFALSNNQLEPVQAQGYRPELDVPYDISFQDQLNEITASERAAQRMSGYNPAAQAMIAGQAYGAKSKVLADQFRANQAMKDQVYTRNRATLNDAQLKNLAIADQQFTRQAQARSNTKATAQEALNSISAKYAQNQLENRQYNTFANMFPNYRFNREGRIQNIPTIQQWNSPIVYSPDGTPNMVLTKDENGNPYYTKIGGDKLPSMAGTPINNETAKKGASIKKAMNGSIVKMLK